MPFCWFGRKSKSSYNLNHEYDGNSHYSIERRARFSDIPEKPKFSGVSQADVTTTGPNRIIRAASSQDLKDSKIGDYTTDEHEKNEHVRWEQKSPEHKIPEDSASENGAHENLTRIDLNEDSVKDKSSSIVDVIEKNEETREFIEAYPEDKQEEEVKYKHFKESPELEIPDDNASKNGLHENLTGIDLNEDSVKDKSSSIVDVIEKNEETREFIEGYPEDKQEEEVKDEHFKESPEVEIPDDNASKNGQHENLTGIDLNQDSLKHESTSIVDVIEKNEETRESIEAYPEDKQEEEIKDKHFKESLADSGKGSETFSNFSTFRPSSLSDISPSEADNFSEIYSDPSERLSTDSLLSDKIIRRRSGVLPKPVPFDEEVAKSLVKYPKTDSEKQFIENAISKNEFLSKVITGRRLQDVIDAMYKKDIRAKEKVIKEGQTGTHMYVAAEGEFEVTKKGKGLINVIKPGEVFGELAILYNAKRLATVKSSTSAKVWVIDGTVYQQLMKKSNIEEQDEIVSFLQNVQILNEVGVEVLRKVARLLKPEFFETGTVIVQEGDDGEKFYIITAGSVTVSREDEGFIGQLHKGQCFGEKAILESITRQATVTAVAPGTECLTLTQKHFIDHFGKIEDISNLTILSQSQIIIEDVKFENAYSHLDLSEFKILKTLGVGGFGRVEFVQHKTDPSLTFALKYLKKYEMVQQDQQHHVINEKQIQMACQSAFIVKMYKTFKDNKYIYFLMEVCLGGDLWSLLQKQPNKRLDEKGARFVAACVLEALSYLHERGIVYRDLKPENLLIDNKGYIKMTDFGFAKRLPPNSKSGTFAGTPEYVAPEIILNRGHDKAVDYWAYGIFIYELLNGKTPFRSNDPSYMRTYNNILNGFEIVGFLSHVGSKAKHLITRLLKKSPDERLGCLRGGVEDIRSHVWFVGFDWERLRNCDIPSPYKPKLSSNIDTRNIDNFARDYDIPPDETSGWDEFF